MSELWIEYISIHELKQWPRNPKLHAEDDIGLSIDRFGFVDPIIVDETTGYIASGHGRVEGLCAKFERGESPPTNIKVEDGVWLAPVVRGNKFTDKKELEAFIVTVNQLTIKGGWNDTLLEDILKDVQPIGFDLVESLQADFEEAQKYDFKNPETGIIPSEVPGFGGVGDVQMTPDGVKYEKEESTKGTDWDDVPGHLKGVWGLDEDKVWDTANALGIPELLPEMILPEIPQPLKTWGGKQDTPDDGESYYLYSFGSTASQGVPYKRSIMCYFTGDTFIETFWNRPAYEVGKMLTSNIVGCVVPDLSYWEGKPKVLHMYQSYRAHWLARFMQEAGVKVIPRFEYFLPEVREFSLLGIPIGTPTLATQLHTWIRDEVIDRIKESLIEGLRIVQPKQLLVYSSVKGREILDDIKGELCVEELITVPCAKEVRRPKDSWKETDPFLLELRKRKHGREGNKSVGGGGT
jgi:hypothetical protein